MWCRLPWLALGLLVACGDIAATNPFDPNAPAAQQASAALEGRAFLVAGFGDSLLERLRVEVRSQSEPAATPRLAELGPARDGERFGRTFRLPEVPPGAYIVTVNLTGFQPAREGNVQPAFPVQLDIGQTVDVGTFDLVPAGGASRGTLVGKVELQGATDHAGTRVEARDTPYSTTTTGQGAFRLELEPGQYTLDFLHEGYGPALVTALDVAPGAVVAVPEQLLVGQPGSVTGRVHLETESGAAERLSEAEVSLLPETGDTALESTNPGTEGAFVFAGVGAGALRVRVTLDGFFDEERRVSVPVGATADAGDFTLRALPATATLTGQAHIEGAPEGSHGGIVVEATGSGSAAVTGSDGAYVLLLAPRATPFQLRFSRPGFTAPPVDVEPIAAGETRALDAVTLFGEPGRILGAVELVSQGPGGPGGPGGLAVRDTEVTRVAAEPEPDATPCDDTIDLLNPDADCAEGALCVRGLCRTGLETLRPDGDGRFVFPAPAAGDYVVTARLDRFFPATLDVTVLPGVDTHAAPLVLRPLPQSATVTGQAQLALANDHSDIVVELVDSASTARTGPDGTFELGVPVSDGRYTLRFRHFGYGEETRQIDGLGPAGRFALPEPVILAGQPGGIVGLVTLPDGWSGGGEPADATVYRLGSAVLPDGEPCDAAANLASPDTDCPEGLLCVRGECRAIEGTTQPDVDGRYVFDGVPAVLTTIVARLALFHPETTEVSVEHGREARAASLDLRPLPTEAFVTGIAQFDGGADHSGIAVELVGTPLSTQTSGEGRFLLAVPVSNLGYTLRFRAAGYGEETRDVHGLAPTEIAELGNPVILQGQPGRIRFLVRAPAEFVDPLILTRGAVDLSRLDGGVVSPVQSVPVPANGAVILEGLAAGSYVVTIAHPSFESAVRSVQLSVGEDLDLGLVRLSLPGNAQRGIIRGAVHLECAGQCDHGGIRVETVSAPFVALTNAEGHFELLAAQNVYTLTFNYPGYEPESVPGVNADPAQPFELPQDVTLHAADGRITGRVGLPPGFDARALLPLAEVRLLAPGGGPPLQAPAHPLASGVFLLDAVDPGIYQLEIALDGFEPLLLDARVAPGADLELGGLNLVPAGAEHVQGTARRADLGNPQGHGGIRVQVLNTPYETLTAADGQFRVQAVPGDVTMRFSAPDYQTEDLVVQDLAPAETRSLAPNETVSLEIVPAAVSGRVLRLTQARNVLPAAGANVSLVDALGDVVATVPSGADGTFQFANRHAGNYTLRAVLTEHATVTHAIALQGGETADAGDLVLDLLRGAIAGTVRRSDAPGRGGATIVARRTTPIAGMDVSGAAVTVAPTDAFTMDLPAGRYEVWTLAEAYVTQGPVTVEVVGGATTDFGAILARRTWSLTAPAVTDRSPVGVTLSGDPDLTHYRLWVDAPVAPPNLGWLPLPAGGRANAALIADGPHTVRAQLATRAYVDGGAGDPVAGLLAAISPVLQAEVVLDTEAPAIVLAQVDAGGPWVREPGVDVLVTCVDAQAFGPDLQLEVAGTDGSHFAGPYRPVVPLQLGAATGNRQLTILCSDAAGHISPPWVLTVGLDPAPPVIRSVSLNAGTPNEPTRQPLVTVHYEVTDSVSGLEGIAIAEGNPDCRLALYQPPGNGVAILPLSPGDGSRSLSLCARDAAGWIVGPARSTNSVILDTSLPGAPTVTLAGGARFTDRSQVDLLIAAAEDPTGYTLELDGDVADGAQRVLLANFANTVALAPGAGIRNISVRLIDPAGNTSPNVTRSVTVDLSPPQVLAVVVGDASGSVNTASPPISLRCVDDHTSTPDLTLAVRVDNVAVQPAGPAYTELVTPAWPVGAAPAGEGAHSVTVTCTDLAGRSTTSPAQQITLDRVAPTRTTFTLNNAGANEATRNRAIVANVAVADAGGTGVAGLAVTEANTCVGVVYGPVTGLLSHTLSPGEGQRFLYLCARDRAGNVMSAVRSTNALTLDTLAPAPPTLALANGAAYTRVAGVVPTVGNVENGATFRIAGDLDPVPAPSQLGLRATVPNPMSLTTGDGLKAVTVSVLDAAGNESAPTTDFITLDTQAPAQGVVTVAGGQPIVNTQIVPVAVSGTAADSMAIWELPAPAVDCSAAAPACGTVPPAVPAFVPFSPASTLTLSNGLGSKRICWKFCDAAGNGSTVLAAGVTISLGTYLSRPTPTLTGLSDLQNTPLRSIAPHSCEVAAQAQYQVRAQGRGLASDTQLQIGDFSVLCAPVGGGATACVPDAAGGCGVGGLCEQNCAEACDATLPPGVVQVAGTYVARLVTPAPLVNGLGTSDIALLDIVAPLPRIRGVDVTVVRNPPVQLRQRRGVIQEVDAQGLPVAQDLEVQITGCGLMSNTQFRLGESFGNVTSLSPPNASLSQTAVARFNTAGIAPSDLEDARLIAVSPSPGGGEFAVPFGLSPRAASCGDSFPCASSLRGTRPVLGSERALFQGFSVPADERLANASWLGGSAAGFRNASGQLLARVTDRSAAGLLPFVLGDARSIRVEDDTGTGRAVSFDRTEGVRNSSGLYDLAAAGSRPRLPPQFQMLTVGDLDGDAVDDLVAATFSGLVRVFWGDGDGLFSQFDDVAMCDRLRLLELVDFTGDGLLDLAGVAAEPDTFCFSAALGERRFGAATRSAGAGHLNGSYPNGWVTDLNGDSIADLLSFDGARPQFRLGRTDLSYSAAGQASPATGMLFTLHVGDVDGDGRRDLVGIRLAGGFAVWRNTGNVAAPFAGMVEYLGGSPLYLWRGVPNSDLIDMNGDGALDVVGTVNQGTNIEISMNTGTGDFVNRTLVDMSPASDEALAADLNGDGRVDLVRTSVNTAHVRYATAGGGFDPAVAIPLSASVGDLHRYLVRDLNRDGAPDLIRAPALDANGAYVDIALGRTSGFPGRVQNYRVAANRYPRKVLLTDIDADADADLVVLRDSGRVELWTWATRNAITDFGYVQEVLAPNVGRNAFLVSTDFQVGDVTNDGRPDVVACSGVGLGIARNSAGGFLPTNNVTFVGAATSHTGVALAEVNGEAPTDVLTIGLAPNQLEAFTWNGAAFVNLWTLPLVGEAHALVTVDLDGNGTRDVVVAEVQGRLRIFRNSGAAVALLGTVVAPAYRLAAGDLNGDGRPDLVATTLCAPPVPCRVSVYLNTGVDPFFGAHTDVVLPREATAVALVDLNHDDRLDIVTSLSTSLGVQLNSGGGAFGPLFEIGKGLGLEGLAAADVNGDGAVDLAVADRTDDVAKVYTMPSPRSWTQELTDLPVTAVTLANGANVVNPQLTIHQAMQYIDALSVRLRIEGQNLQSLTVSLRAPDGQTVELDRGATRAGASVWQATYPTTLAATGNLGLLYNRWQPEGDWSLVVTNNGATASVRDFAVITHGAFVR